MFFFQYSTKLNYPVYVNLHPKLQKNEKTPSFGRRPPDIAHQWLIVCNGWANQIAAFALVYSRILLTLVKQLP